jgi:exosortase A
MTVAATTTDGAPRSVPAGFTALLLLAAVALLLWVDIAALLVSWRHSATYSHGYLVALAVPWLIYRERARLAAERHAPTTAALVGLLGLLLLWSLAFAAHVDLVREALLPLIMLAAILAVLGRDAAQRLSFPLAWFWFAVPLFDFLPPYLQRFTATVVQLAVRAVGIPVLREGNFLTVPAGSFEVAGSCSGLNFLLVSLTVSTLYGYLHGWHLKPRLKLVALAVLVALVANWLRVFVIVVAGQLTHMQTSLVREGHYVFGWWLFAAGLVLFFLLADRFEAPEAPRPLRALAPAGAVVVGRRALAVLLLIGATAGVAYAREYHAERLARSAAPVVLPAGLGAWVGPRPTEFAWQPVFAGASSEARGAYEGPGGAVYVDLAYYAVERKGAKLVGYPSDPNGHADVVSEEEMRLESEEGRSLPVRLLHLRSSVGEWQVLQWYEVGAVPVADARAVKWREALRAFTGGTGAAAISLAVPCLGSCGVRESSLLVAFAKEMQGSLRARVRAPGGRS